MLSPCESSMVRKTAGGSKQSGAIQERVAGEVSTAQGQQQGCLPMALDQYLTSMARSADPHGQGRSDFKGVCSDPCASGRQCRDMDRFHQRLPKAISWRSRCARISPHLWVRLSGITSISKCFTRKQIASCSHPCWMPMIATARAANSLHHERKDRQTSRQAAFGNRCPAESKDDLLRCSVLYRSTRENDRIPIPPAEGCVVVPMKSAKS